MTLVIVVYVREGIVIASDSRLTLSTTRQEGDHQIVNQAISQSDSAHKVFLTDSKVGIATAGQAQIDGIPIAGFVESFIKERTTQANLNVDDIARELLAYFRGLTGPPETIFLVAGYTKVENSWQQQVWEVRVATNAIRRVEDGSPGAYWAGEADVLSRLTQPVGTQKPDGSFVAYPNHPLQVAFFTLQDAIDYAVYALRVTIDTMKFHQRPKTVGGPIDILVLKPDDAVWIQKKELHA